MFTVVFHAGRLSTDDAGIALHRGVVSAMKGQDATIHGPDGQPVLEIAVRFDGPDHQYNSAVVHFCGSEDHARVLELESLEAGAARSKI